MSGDTQITEIPLPSGTELTIDGETYIVESGQFVYKREFEHVDVEPVLTQKHAKIDVELHGSDGASYEQVRQFRRDMERFASDHSLTLERVDVDPDISRAVFRVERGLNITDFKGICDHFTKFMLLTPEENPEGDYVALDVTVMGGQ